MEKTECGARSLSKHSLFFLKFDFNETPRFPLYAPIHLQCLSQFETLHYPWIPSLIQSYHRWKSKPISFILDSSISSKLVPHRSSKAIPFLFGVGDETGIPQREPTLFGGQTGSVLLTCE